MILKIVSKTLQLIPLLTLPIVTIGTAQAQQALNAPQDRAGLNIAMLNRAQQVVYIESGKFTARFQDLGVDLSRLNGGGDYSYSLLRSRTNTLQYAIARRRDLKSYVGRVAVIRHSNGEATTTSIVCENDRLGIHRPPTPRIDTNFKLVCAPGTTQRQPQWIPTPEQLNASGKTFANSMNRAQQAHILETEKFATHFSDLGLGTGEMPSHEVSIQASDRFTYQYVISRRDDLKSYVGVVVIGIHSNGEFTTIAMVCENSAPGRSRPAAPIIRGEGLAPVCAPGTQVVQ